MHGTPLFPEEFEAWANGPVAPDLFKRHKGEFVVSRGFFGPLLEHALTEYEYAAIDHVVGCLKNWTGASLSELTHSEAPWLNARHWASAQCAIEENGILRGHESLLPDEAARQSGVRVNKPAFSKMQVGRAGKALISPLSSSEERTKALAVVNYWREIHAEALQRALEDIERVCGIASEILIAGRIKKLATIVDKLNRPRTPSDLQTTYDIAGCRLVVPDMATLNQVYCELAKISAFDGPKTERHDYIARPRPSGYRGRHVILRYGDLGLWT